MRGQLAQGSTQWGSDPTPEAAGTGVESTLGPHLLTSHGDNFVGESICLCPPLQFGCDGGG